MAPHEEFLELCAVSLSGELTEGEQRKLQEHLKDCPSCREALAQFKSSVKATVPVAAKASMEVADSDPSFSVEKAEKAFLARFDREGGFEAFGPSDQPSDSSDGDVPNGAGWGQLWVPFAAILVLCLALGIASYRIGMKRGGDTVSAQLSSGSVPSSLEARLSEAGRERQGLLEELAVRNQTIAELRRGIQEQSASSPQHRAVPATDQNKLSGAETETAAKLDGLQKRLEAEEQARSQQATHVTELEAKVADLSKQLQESAMTVVQQKRQLDERESALSQDRDLLEHDRDIRDLMGARQLHVVDVYDVGGAGTNKPYGRVFYTQGKSLIFYAYDLDQTPGVRRASTFQAWGRRGPNKAHALNLGIFYEDNAANKRWVVKFDDAKSLAQIDGVFVTIEPDTHSNTPRGKQVLFAYLNVDPNHP